MLSRLMTVREQWLLLGVAGAIVLGAGVLLWRGNVQSTPSVDTFVVAPAIAPAPAPSIPKPAQEPVEPEEIAVGILGAVNKEGLYYFAPGARVKDLLVVAGGALPESDLSDINRTALLLDETTLLVPAFYNDGSQRYSYPTITYNPPPYTRSAWYQFEEAAAHAEVQNDTQQRPSSGTGSASVDGLIDINTASQSQLESLPGIGPVTAKKIVAHRESQPFSAPSDLEKVSGIGPAKMAAVRDLIAVN